MPGFDGFTGEYRAEVDVRASIILGPDPNGERRAMPMRGSVLMREWPYPGYERRTLPDGRVQLQLEMVESRITGQLAGLGADLTITETTAARNFGTLTQVFPEQDFPAAFELARKIVANTPLGQLHNDQAIVIRAVIDAIPPIGGPESFVGVNIFEAVNTPVPLLNEAGAVAAFFSGSRETMDNCRVRMVGLG